jgi:hypothetical protein
MASMSRDEMLNGLNAAYEEVDTLRAQLAERDHQLGLIGTCLGDILVAAGHVSPGFGLTGPQLLQFGEELRDSLSASEELKSCGACANGCISGCQLEKDSPPVQRDEEVEFLKWYEVYVSQGWSVSKVACRTAWQARAALERKP